MNLYFLNSINILVILDYLDLIIIFVFLLLFLLTPSLASLRAKRSRACQSEDNTDKNFLLMNRSLSLPLFVATLCSTWYGGIIGVTQIAFQQGFYSFVTQGLAWYASYFLFALLLAKKIRRTQVLSLPELIGLKFGSSARKLSACALFIHALPVSYALSIGILIQMVFEINLAWAVILGLSLVTIYSISGGFKSIVLTDAIQFLLMFISVLLVIIFSAYNFGTYNFLANNLAPSYFNWHGDHSPWLVCSWFLIACSTTLVHPVFYQRCLAAKSDAVAVRGILWAIFCWFLFDCCTTLGGMYAKAVIPEADSAKAYLFYALQLLPSGLRGVFIMGILATILSTIDSFLFVSGTSISYDFLGSKKLGHQIMIATSSLSTVVIAILFGANFEQLWFFREGILGFALLGPVLFAVFDYRQLAIVREFDGRVKSR